MIDVMHLNETCPRVMYRSAQTVATLPMVMVPGEPSLTSHATHCNCNTLQLQHPATATHCNCNTLQHSAGTKHVPCISRITYASLHTSHMSHFTYHIWFLVCHCIHHNERYPTNTIHVTYAYAHHPLSLVIK